MIDARDAYIETDDVLTSWAENWLMSKRGKKYIKQIEQAIKKEIKNGVFSCRVELSELGCDPKSKRDETSFIEYLLKGNEYRFTWIDKDTGIIDISWDLMNVVDDE